MSSYDDLVSLESKLSQKLALRSFADDNIVMTSHWPLLNQLLHRSRVKHQVSEHSSATSEPKPLQSIYPDADREVSA